MTRAGHGPTVLAVFGPTAVGKTDAAIAVAERLRDRGEDPVAVGCDALQVYRGLEVLTGAPSIAERAALEHRLVGVADVHEEWSAGRHAEAAHAEIDALRAEGRRPIVVGGTGLYLRASLSALSLRPPVDPAIRAAVEAGLAERGAAALHAELPAQLRTTTHPHDRKRIARQTELLRAGLDPATDTAELWTARLRVPTLLVGLTLDRAVLRDRIERRVATMVAEGAAAEAERATAGSRTAAAALGVRELASGDADAMLGAHVRYARRQLTWMRKLNEVHIVDRTERSPEEIASQVLRMLDEHEPGSRPATP